VSSVLIEQLANAVQGTLTPDCTLLLDLPVVAGLERVRQRSGAAPTDRFEKNPRVSSERVRDTYLALAKRPMRRASASSMQPDRWPRCRPRLRGTGKPSQAMTEVVDVSDCI